MVSPMMAAASEQGATSDERRRWRGTVFLQCGSWSFELERRRLARLFGRGGQRRRGKGFDRKCAGVRGRRGRGRGGLRHRALRHPLRCGRCACCLLTLRVGGVALACVGFLTIDDDNALRRLDVDDDSAWAMIRHGRRFGMGDDSTWVTFRHRQATGRRRVWDYRREWVRRATKNETDGVLHARQQS